MKRQGNRMSAPEVKDGKVQRKNRTELSRHYNNYQQDQPMVDRLPPGPGYRHLLLKRDVAKFIGILPDWEELSRGLDAVILSPGRRDAMGWYRPGVVAVCAWERELTGECSRRFVEEHREVMERLGIRIDRRSRQVYFVHWTELSAKGFQLMHILLHELGHHRDRMTTRSQFESSRGESYAEKYALRYADGIWAEYFKVFGW